MNSFVKVKAFSEPEIRIKEILRYAGIGELNLETEELLKSCLDEVHGKFTYKVCYEEFHIKETDDGVCFPFSDISSKDLKNNLSSCKSAILFAATIGVEIDRLIARYAIVSPARALMFQAIGAERIESLCSVFNSYIEESHPGTKPRFSPGYGDFALDFQKEIFAVLDCYRKIGISLNNSLLMSPSKSVTAIIGITDVCVNSKKNHGCLECTKNDCEYRRKK